MATLAQGDLEVAVLLGPRQVVVVAKIEPHAGALGKESNCSAADVETRDVAAVRQDVVDIGAGDTQHSEAAGQERPEAVLSPFPRCRQHRVSHKRDGVALADERLVYEDLVVGEESRRPDNHSFDTKYSRPEQRHRPANIPMDF